MTTYVLVPGACHGGWWYRPLVDLLVAAGHSAVAVTPIGLEENVVARERAVTLDDHVEQATAALVATPRPIRDPRRPRARPLPRPGLPRAAAGREKLRTL